ncbi:MAG: urea carboxylase [Pseudomonadota bacterium]
MTTTLKRVLIANRGAIAVRIQRTLKRLGMESIAVFSEADRASRHVAEADQAVSLGAGRAQETYLDADRLLSIAAQFDADAIHPGYGFLSENADFSAAVEKAGHVFLGPTADQINAFGLKHEARRLAEAAAVPLLAGSGLLNSLAEATAAAATLGYPVILKSSAGGGGIGMRVCRSAEDLERDYDAVVAQAGASFGDARVYLERFIDDARHIEVQAFGDGAGRVAILGDRDCSLQRRNQKIIEEAPAPALPEELRAVLHQAAERLLTSVQYRSAGTVEFLYDRTRSAVSFLEVNARLQVEHGVTELVTDVDLVEWMLRLGAGDRSFITSKTPVRHAIQVRVYAEDPHRDFRPSPGLITNYALPASTAAVRVDDWAVDGVVVPPDFDPMLAKVLTAGDDREAARAGLVAALADARVDGVQTNLAFLRAALTDPTFVTAEHNTATAAALRFSETSMEVLAPGTLSTVQDVGGRMGYWHIGVPPSGAFDGCSLARANVLVGNAEEAAGLELLANGPTLRFASDTRIALCGALSEATLDGEAVPHDQAVHVQAGQSLTVGKIAVDGVGLRAYLAIAGGIDVPQKLGSRATFDLGNMGGHCGRALRSGDVLPLGPMVAEAELPVSIPAAVPLAERTQLRVVAGPLAAPDFLTPAFLTTFYDTDWVVHYNSSRTGIRLQGPTPEWARNDGGDAGLHPSNVHDNAYAFGAIDFTGDMPIILGPDGPSLGGFVSPAAICEADSWKLGQLRAGDRVRFLPIDLGTAQRLSPGASMAGEAPVPESNSDRSRRSQDVALERDTGRDIVLRAAGDRFALLEFGPAELDLRSRIRAEALRRWLEQQDSSPILEITPGIRSLQFRIPRSSDRAALLRLVQDGIDQLGKPEDLEVPSRIVHLPLAWDDPATQEATDRYARTVRSDAPWCPRNIEFIRRINGLKDEAEVKNIVYRASYLVLGLGDVYLGAPVATPIDPRHRLVTTKYNPARTWTPENAVGIGGAYLCIYGMEGPGGYQFVGRTIQVWSNTQRTAPFVRPWLLRSFDQLRFYPVSNDELLELRRDFPLGRVPIEIEETRFALGDYEAFLAEHTDDIAAFRSRQQTAFAEERARWAEAGLGTGETLIAPAPEVREETLTGTAIDSPVTGSVWKVLREVGDRVEAGETILIVESMKTEFPVLAPESGQVIQILAGANTPIDAGQAVAVLDPVA